MRNQTLALVEPTDIVKKLIGWPDECGRNPSVLGWKWSLMLVAARTNSASARTKAPRTTGESAGNDHKYSRNDPRILLTALAKLPIALAKSAGNAHEWVGRH